MFASDRASWQNPRVLLILMLVFLAGACAGAMVVRAGRVIYANSAGNLSYEGLKKDLNLTPVQAEQIKVVLDDFASFNEEIKAQIRSVRAMGKHKIMSVLNPDQQKHFEKICSDLQFR